MWPVAVFAPWLAVRSWSRSVSEVEARVVMKLYARRSILAVLAQAMEG